MPDITQLSNIISTLRQLDTQLINTIGAGRDLVKSWEIAPYPPITDQMVADAGFPTKTADDVQNLVNAFAAFRDLYDTTWGSVLEEMRT